MNLIFLPELNLGIRWIDGQCASRPWNRKWQQALRYVQIIVVAGLPSQIIWKHRMSVIGRDFVIELNTSGTPFINMD